MERSPVTRIKTAFRPAFAALSACSALLLAGCMETAGPGPAREAERNELSVSAAIANLPGHLRGNGTPLPAPQVVSMDRVPPQVMMMDWRVYGNVNQSTMARKATSNTFITKVDFGVITHHNPSNPSAYVQFKWDNGASPYPTGQVARGLKANAVNDGWGVSYQSTTAPRIAHLYVSAYKATGTFSVKGRNGSIPVTFTQTMGNSTGFSTWRFSVVYRTAVNELLEATWRKSADHGGGYIVLHGAAVETYWQNTAPSTATVAAAPNPSGQPVLVQNMALPLSIVSLPSDVDGIAGVEYYRNGELVGTSTSGAYNLPAYVEPKVGVHHYTAVATDKFGMRSTVTPPVTAMSVWWRKQLKDFGFYNGGNGISDGGHLTGTEGALLDIRARTTIQHPNTQNVMLQIVNYDNGNEMRRPLATNRGDGSKGYAGTYFRDDAPTPIAFATPPFTGEFKGEVNLRSNFAGRSGTSYVGWSLKDPNEGWITISNFEIYALTSNK